MNPEFLAISIIAGAAEAHPELPVCVGPLFIHVNGLFECHGVGCEASEPVSCLDSHFHGPDAVSPCSEARRLRARLRGVCPRCAGHN
jgi:hypothetical protein